MSKSKAPTQEKNSQALIEEADKLFEIKEYNKAEYVYAEALRIADRGLEKDYNTQLLCFQKLGDIYLEYKEYPKATALYNTALILSKDKFPDNKFQSQNQEQVQNNPQSNLIAKIKNTEKLFLREVLGKEIDETLVSLYELDKAHKQHLVKLRNRCREEIERIDREYNPYVKEGYDPLIPEIRILEIKRAEAINELYKSIATDIKSLIREMLKESYDVLGEPPCKYSIIALGSLAREEATPYSDFEWAILIEEGLTEEKKKEAKEYFRNLTKLMHIKVINIGETILPSMHIKSLNDFYSKDQIKDNWYYDEIVPKGFGFDGLMPKACKIPLGTRAAAPNLKEGDPDPNGKEIYELIRTPKEMAEFQNEKWYKQDNLLGNGMATFAFIKGDEELAKRYREEIEEVNKDDLKDIKKKEVLELLKRDIITYDTRLDDPNEEGKLYEVKKEIYRLPDRTIDGIASYYNLKSNSSWDRINELEKERTINKEARDNLHIAVGIATEIRLRTYLKSDKQKETMNAIHLMFKAKEKLQESKEEEQNQQLYQQQQQQITEQGTTEEELKEIFLLPSQEMLFRFYYTILPLAQKLKKFFPKEDSYTEQNTINSININERELLGRTREINVNIANNENTESNSLFDYGNKNKGLIYKRLLQYEKAERYFIEAIQQEPQNCILINNLGSICISLGKYKEAESCWQNTLRIMNDFGNKHPVILNNLASAYYFLGQYKKAIEYYEEVLNIEKAYGDHHINIADTLSNLGSVFSKIGQYKKAIEYYKEALSIKKAYGRNHPSVANTLNNLGLVYSEIGQYKKAIEYYEEAFHIGGKIYGRNHPNVANTLNNSGLVYSEIGQYKKAIECYKEALNIKEKVFKKHHPDVAKILSNLSIVYYKLGKYKKQKSVLEEVIIIIEKTVSDKNHPAFASVLNDLANSYSVFNKYEQAIKCYKTALYIKEEIYGRTHPSVADTLNNLGLVYSEISQHEQAIEYYEEAFCIKEEIYGRTHPSIADTLNNLGLVYSEISQYEQAIAYYNEALNIKKQIFGSRHPSVADILNNLGLAYSEIGQYEQAIAYYDKALGINKQVFGSHHPSIAMIIINLSSAFHCIGYFKNTIPFLREALNIYKQTLSELHSDTANVYNNLGNAYYALQDYAKAIKYHEKALMIRIKVLGENHIAVGETLNNLANVYGSLSNYTYELKLLKKSLAIKEKTYGINHPNVANTLSNIGGSYKYLKQYKEAYYYTEKAYNIFLNFDIKDRIEFCKNRLIELLSNLGNKALLEGNIEEAKEYYKIIGLDPFNIKNHLKLASIANEANNLEWIVQEYKVLARLDPNNVSVYHNLGCFYHIEAKQALAKNNTEHYKAKIKAAEESFLKVIKEKEYSGIYAEYSNFLCIIGRVKEALPYILRAIELKDDKRELSYGVMEKLTLDKNLQKEVGYYWVITLKASHLAYYLLIVDHKEFSFNKDEELNKQQVISYIKEFEQEVMKESNALSYSLLGYCYKATEEYNLAKEIFKKVIEIDSENYVAGSNYLECNKVINGRLNGNNNNVSSEHNDITSKRKLTYKAEELNRDKAASIIQRSWREYIDRQKEDINKNR